MNIAVIGLGLIGGSFCKTLKKYTKHTILGYDLDDSVTQDALSQGAIDRMITPDELSLADLTIVSLHPIQTIRCIIQYASDFRPGSIVIDTCGVKESIVSQVEPVLSSHGVSFVGCHPMAGREFSGFSYSLDSLFDHASFIVTPTKQTNPQALQTVTTLAKEIHFEKIVSASPKEHDQIIAFTSQLAHVVSNAYVKSPTLQKEMGFSAGSFLDLTRVAKLNESMWTDLFFMNRSALLFELDTIIHHLEEYKQALDQNNSDRLKSLLRDGRIKKEDSLSRHSASQNHSK